MDIPGLKNSVKAFAAEGAALRAAIQRACGPERHRLWAEKRRVGSEARDVLLAYAFARGVPYRRVEPRCREGNQAQATWITRVLEPFGGAALAPGVIDAWLGAACPGAPTEAVMG